jgi:hypothetical protein
MPAYTKELPRRECVVCGERATVEVLNDRNGSLGPHCRRDGQRKVAELNGTGPAVRQYAGVF